VSRAEAAPAEVPRGEPDQLAPPPDTPMEEGRGLVARWFRIRRGDVLAMALLLVVAFGLRFFSPILPDLFSGHGFLSNCVHSTPIDPKGDTGTLCGLSYPYQRANQDGQPPEGEVFDEIYFGDFAHNDLKGISYFDPEPPVAKYIIAAGEWLYGEWRILAEGARGDPADLGFTTFGWRIMSVIFGSLVVPLMYLFALKLWPNRLFAWTAGILCCFDGMFFIQSRIGMIDIFPIFFVMLAYTLFLFHLRARSPATAVLTLLATGTVLGVAIASKWIALAALASIAFFLVAAPLARMVDWRRLMSRPGARLTLPGGVRPGPYALTYLVAVVALPVVIYIVSWVPFFTRGQFHTFGDLIAYQYQTYHYHATLTATHPYGSKWYTWPLLIRPVAYYFQGQGLGVDAGSGQPLVAGMVNIGNPVIWWASIPALVALVYFVVRWRSWPALLILAGFVTQYLPFARITRVMFLYHMFGGLIFMVLGLAFVLVRAQLAISAEGWSGTPRRRQPVWLVVAFLALVVLVFSYLYPVWTGLPISYPSYINGLWQGGKMWLPSWI
jgi:dolichyl-phosphate-mannose-protein mannosyltransferase